MSLQAEGKRQQQRERFDLKALYETSRLLSGSLDLDFVLSNLLLIAMTKAFVTRGVVFLFDPLKEHFQVAAVKGIADWKQNTTIELDYTPSDAILTDETIPKTLQDQRIVLVLPIAFQGRHIGLIGLGRKLSGEPFSETEMEFIKTLVNMSSAAVHNSLMVEELRQANHDLDAKIQELNTLFDLSREFNAAQDRQRLVRLFSFALMGQLLVQRHIFLLRRPQATDTTGETALENLRVVATQGLTEDDVTDDLIERLSGLADMVNLNDESAAEWAALKEHGLQILLPLRQGQITQGIVGLGPKLTGKPYEAGDVEFLYALGNLALTSIQNSYLVEEQIEKERLAEEMRLASQIQERLLPQEVPEVSGLDVAAYATPSREVGGDYFDLSMLPNNRFMVAIADVTGKGVPAALLMANIQACLRALLPLDLPLDEATSRINGVIHANTDFDKFITFFWGIYDLEHNCLHFVNAGHDPPIHMTPDGDIKHLEDGGLLLGIFSQADYQKGQTNLAPGDTIALYTDG